MNVDPFRPTVGELCPLQAVEAFLTLAEGATSNDDTMARLREYFKIISRPWWVYWGYPGATRYA